MKIKRKRAKLSNIHENKEHNKKAYISNKQIQSKKQLKKKKVRANTKKEQKAAI